GGLIVQHRLVVARDQRYRRKSAVLAETVVIQVQRSILKVQHHAPDLLADRPEYALITDLAREPHTQAKGAVGNEWHDEAAMDGLPTWLESARPYRLTMWRAIAQLLQHDVVIERIHHVEPGSLVKCLDQLVKLLRMLVAHINRLRKILV